MDSALQAGVTSSGGGNASEALAGVVHVVKVFSPNALHCTPLSETSSYGFRAHRNTLIITTLHIGAADSEPAGGGAGMQSGRATAGPAQSTAVEADAAALSRGRGAGSLCSTGPASAKLDF